MRLPRLPQSFPKALTPKLLAKVVLAYGTGHFLGGCYRIVQGRRQAKAEDFAVTEKERMLTFDRLAPQWDFLVGFSEWRMGLGKLRRSLVSRCEGEVLEVAAGTGRNLPHYDARKVKRLVVVDASRAMLEESLKKKR
eukprot:Selendium_serpulae@DN9843_c0_g1_i1.p3